MPDVPRERLIAATAKWRQLDSERDAARDEVLDAAAAILKAGALPADVVGLTPFSDALVRRETRKRGAPKAARGPKRKEESIPAGDPSDALVRPTITPFRAPVMSSREAEFLDMAESLTPEREAELVELLYRRNELWFKLNRRPGTTDKELVRLGIRDGKLTASDLH